MAEHNNRPARRMGPPGRGPIHGGEKPKDFKGAIKSIFKYLGAYRFALIGIGILAVGGTVFNVIGPKILGKATTVLSEGLMGKIYGTGAIDFTKIGTILLTVLGLYFISALLTFLCGWLTTGMVQKTCYRLRKEITEKINRMPLKYFESRPYGDVLSRITNDVDMMGQGLQQSVTQVITAVTQVIGVFIMMMTISVKMTLVVLITLPVAAILIGFVVKISQKHFYAQQKYLGEVNGQVEEIYGGHAEVKAFNREKNALNEFSETNNKLYNAAWKSQFLSGLMMPMMKLVSNGGYVAVAVFGAFSAIRGHITIGEIQAFIQYVKNFTQPIQQVAQISNVLQTMAAASERVFEFLNEEEEAVTADALPVENVKGEITFDHVRFGYNDDKVVIKDFSAHVRPGQKIAIVGPTGAGKTTIVKLLMRFYDVWGGWIKLDGKDIRNFDRHELRENFGMVLQDTWLFNGSIMENIRFGRLDATDEEVIAAAKTAYADHFISCLPQGYDTELNEETTNISQGQKQLLTIARAILADNPVLILDEATSSVDTRTEARIQQGMDNLLAGRTSFIIAHRLSTIKNADLILVIKDGDIIEQGNHEELLAKKGFYADLYNSQFEQIS